MMKDKPTLSRVAQLMKEFCDHPPEVDIGACPPSSKIDGLFVILSLALIGSIVVFFALATVTSVIYEFGKHILGVWQ